MNLCRIMFFFQTFHQQASCLQPCEETLMKSSMNGLLFWSSINLLIIKSEGLNVVTEVFVQSSPLSISLCQGTRVTGPGSRHWRREHPAYRRWVRWVRWVRWGSNPERSPTWQTNPNRTGKKIKKAGNDQINWKKEGTTLKWQTMKVKHRLKDGLTRQEATHWETQKQYGIEEKIKE